MRFVDLLRLTVLLCAGAGTALAVACVVGASNDQDTTVVIVSFAWWLIAGVIGMRLSRRAEASPPIQRVLADARTATMMPEHRPGAVTANRLWPLAVVTVAAGACAFFLPQVPGIATGFMVIWSLAWRRQDSAVTAIEERDGVTFYVERTSPFSAIVLVRTPGFRREVPTVPAAG